MVMKRRKNADDRLRKLERAAKSNEYAAVAAYWRACLAAGELPKSNASIVDHENYDEGWILQSPKVTEAEGMDGFGALGHFRYSVFITQVPNAEKPDAVGFLLQQFYNRERKFGKYVTLEDGIKLVKKILGKILEDAEKHFEKENPRKKQRTKRKNADDSVQKAKRAYLADKNKDTRAEYWKACLRAGILPEPTFITGIQREWCLLEEEYIEALREESSLPPNLVIVHCSGTKDRYHVVEHLISSDGPNQARNRAIHTTLEAMAEDIKKRLWRLLTTENPRRKRVNSDDELRRLQRLAPQNDEIGFEARERLRNMFAKTGHGFVPPEITNVLDRHGGFTALITSKRNPRGNSLWRPGSRLKGNHIGKLVKYETNKFYQAVKPVTWAYYKVKGYRYLIITFWYEISGLRLD